MQKIKEAGLENEIDDCIEVETNYKIKKIVEYFIWNLKISLDYEKELLLLVNYINTLN